MNEKISDSPKIGQLGSNDDELFFGVHNDVLKNIARLPAKAREISANALRAATQRPLGEYAEDLSVAIKAARDSLFGPRP